jgi:hypothetical protein
MVEAAVEHGPHRSALTRDPKSVFDLSQDLRLAQHHRLERCRDSKNVTDGLLPTLGEVVTVELLGPDAAHIRQRLDDTARIAGLRHTVDLDSIAGRKQHHLGQPSTEGQVLEAASDLRAGHGELLAQLERRRHVVEADGDQTHD